MTAVDADASVLDASAVDDGPPLIDTAAVSLNTQFFYQNRQTGQPSASSLTARQLCRILCPANGSASTSMITQQTLLLGYDTTNNVYDPIGWQIASSVPLLREACANWYYESVGGVKGPVSTRILAELLNDNNNDLEVGDKLEKTARVYSSDSNNGKWTRIQDSPYLLFAIEALTEVTTMPTTWPVNDDETNTQQVATMTYHHDENDGDQEEEEEDGPMQQKVKDDLEAFLSSTDHLARHAAQVGEVAVDDESDEEEYESDGGTRYVRDSRTGNWIHEDLAPKREKKTIIDDRVSSLATVTTKGTASLDAGLIGSKKRKKAKFTAKNSRNWIYVTGLPKDTNEEEVVTYFTKVGIIDLDPESQKPKVKLYRDNASGILKGDASICYARPESVELALQILDENIFRDNSTLSVQRAKFEQHGTTFDGDGKTGGRRIVSEAKRKVARLAALQAVGWDEGENGRIAGGLKGLRIVVLMNMFDPKTIQNDTNDEKLQSLQEEVHAQCEAIGIVEKITVFSKHPAGVIIVKFTQPNAASDAVQYFNGKIVSNGRKVGASYWDGVTDYTCKDDDKEEKDTEKRLDEFGDWLEDQDLPDEFKLQVET